MSVGETVRYEWHNKVLEGEITRIDGDVIHVV